MDAGADATKSASLRFAKQSLRGRVLAARDDLPPHVRAADSAAIGHRLRALPAFNNARCVLLTLPFRSEWDTRDLAEHALREGKRVVVPRVQRETRVLALHAIGNLGADIVPGYIGIPEPRDSLPIVPPADVDFIVMPGVAFDAQRRRLGYGGGFFDRLLTHVAPTTPKIAGAFDVQIVERVPTEPHDHVVDAVVTPTLMIRGDR